MDRLELWLLGTPVVLSGGRRIALPSRKAAVLLARLATARGNTVGRAEAAAFLWPDAEVDKARASLRQTLARLRQTLGADAIEADAQTVALAASRWWIDIADLETPLGTEQAPGEFVAGHYFAEPQIDLWLDEERRHFKERCLTILRAQRDRHRDGDAAHLVNRCHAILTLDPYDEATHRDLMRALAALGHTGRAIKQYETLEALQRSDLDVSPDPETRALIRELRQRAGAPKHPTETGSSEPEKHDDIEAMRLVTVVSVPAAQTAPTVMEALRSLTVRQHGVVFEGNPTRLIIGLSDAAEGAALDALAHLWPHRAEMQIGVASGLVLMHRGTGSEPSGTALAEADMLAHLAAPSEILVSDRLWRQLGGAVRGTPTDIRGRRAWVLSGLRTGERRAAPPFVGREAERNQVAAFLDYLDAGRGGVLVVTGSAGIGKTRLIDEVMEERNAQRHALAQTGFQAFGDDATAYRQRLALAICAACDAPPSVQEMPLHLRRTTRALLGASGAPTAGLAAPEDHALSRDVIVELMRRLTAQRPLVVRIEDTHWARPAQVEYLVTLFAAAADLPVAFVATERPCAGGLAAAMKDRSAENAAVVLSLSPLGPQDARNLLCHRAGGCDDVSGLIEKAGGNPLFLTHLAATGLDGEVPTSLIALVQEELDHQPPEVTAACHRAAVLGHCFPTAAFAAVFPQSPPADLVRSGFLTVGEKDTAFTHALIQEAVYAMIPDDRRAVLHGAAAQVLAAQNPVLWAEHALRAGRDRTAAKASLSATELLFSQHRLAAAGRFVEAGLSCDADDETRARLLYCRANIKRDSGASEEALEDYAAAFTLAEEADLRVRIALKTFATRKYLGDLTAARKDLSVAGKIASSAVLSFATRSQLAQELGDAAFQDGDGEACLAHNEEAYRIAREAGLVLEQARALGGIGDAHYARIAIDEALRAFTECVTLAVANELDVVANAHRPMVAISRLYVEAGALPLEEGAMAAEQARVAHDRRNEILALAAMSEIQAFAADAAGLNMSAMRMRALIGGGSNRFHRDLVLVDAFRDWLCGRPQDAMRRAGAYLAENRDPYIAPEMAGLAAVLTSGPKAAVAAIDNGRRILETGAVAHSFLAFHHFAMRVAVRWDRRALARELADDLATGISLERHRFASLAHAQTLAALDGSAADNRDVHDEILAANLGLFVHKTGEAENSSTER